MSAIIDGSNASSLPADSTINGVTVGKGASSVSTNTAVGVTALGANTTGSVSVAVGSQALKSNTTGASNVAVGANALYSNLASSNNIAIGDAAMIANSSGGSNVAIGSAALQANTTASNNTAVGYQAGYSNTTGAYNTFIGDRAGISTTTGGYCVAIGTEALRSNTTGRNTAVGTNAGYGITTGTFNQCFGDNAGASLTTGNKNTILGAYSGNQGGLDIRTASNYIVLSDGDGNPLLYTYNGYFAQNTNSGGRFVQYGFNIANVEKASIFFDNNNTNLYVRSGGTGGVYLTTGGTSWTSNSDERLKENLVEITDGLNKVCSLRSVIGNFIADETKKKTPFLIAQDVQAVLPEAVSLARQSKEDDTEYLGVAYTETIPLLVAAIKELKAEVDALKAAK